MHGPLNVKQDVKYLQVTNKNSKNVENTASDRYVPYTCTLKNTSSLTW